MSSLYLLVGYDKITEKMTTSITIPMTATQQAIEIAALTAIDEKGDWELLVEQAEAIAALIGGKIDITKEDFFLEYGGEVPT